VTCRTSHKRSKVLSTIPLAPAGTYIFFSKIYLIYLGRYCKLIPSFKEHLNFLGGIMKSIGYKVVSLAIILMLAVPGFAQEEGEAKKSLADNLAGYTAGLNLGYAVVGGETYDDGLGPVLGLAGNTPYGFAVGPFNVGVGFSVEAMMAEKGTSVGVLGTLNTTIYQTPQGPISYWAGVGYYDGLGLAGGLYFDYMVPDMPLVIKPYGRAVIQTKSEDEGGGMTGFVNIGVMALYDISTLLGK